MNPRYRQCSNCKGAKFLPTGHCLDVEPCPRCDGTGVESIDEDAERGLYHKYDIRRTNGSRWPFKKEP